MIEYIDRGGKEGRASKSGGKEAGNIERSMKIPNWEHLEGTEKLGRYTERWGGNRRHSERGSEHTSQPKVFYRRTWDRNLVRNFFFFFLLFRASLETYGSSQARDRIRARPAGLPQPQQYTSVSHICSLHHSSWQYWILHPLSKARDRAQVLKDASQIHFHCAVMGTPWFRITTSRNQNSNRPERFFLMNNYKINWKEKSVPLSSSY